MMPLVLLLLLLVLHVLADFYWQPAAWVTAKRQLGWRATALYWHGLCHAGPMWLVMLALGYGLLNSLLAAAVIFVSHILIDLLKARVSASLRHFIWDQLAHLVVLVGLCWLLSDATQRQTLTAMVQPWLEGQRLLLVVPYLLAYLLVLKPVSVVIATLLKPWSNALNQHQGHDQETLDKAGEKIGYLERLLILTFMLLGQFSAIGFLLAAKSVFRFGELKNERDKKLTEYVMLGTLASFVCTLLVGLLVKAWLNLLGVS
ncbi:DUF3307 domain-containing protein [Idiomarina xiamenensis]|uniref:DUF3307 domain-containing protein n=1 Tax=Idiomarina xiamenensis 10-D-4 TaxID=740709 RepID=K2KQI2_9GAMM|nr:DUF3307 domain-containing protein [Idiomarina xiamenensis]EKE84699.1 hypothetical protein A10D4_03775 [Idiomarina xiamenensis 10-D-4]